MPTAAAVIIGNEILTGKFQDENGPWLIGRCRSIGLDMIRVSIIDDTVASISDEVRRLSHLVDWVFTSGGVGPTHDDVTMSGIAAAFGVETKRNADLEALIRRHMGERVNEDALRMADIPDGSVLWQERSDRFPVVVCRNVIIFPGVPAYLQGKFDDIAHRLGGTPMVSQSLRTHLTEPELASTLREADLRWPHVAIGSYPRFDTQPRSVVITFDSRDNEALAACYGWVDDTLSAIERSASQHHAP